MRKFARRNRALVGGVVSSMLVLHAAPAPGSEESRCLAWQSARLLRLALVRHMDELESDPGAS